MTQSQQRLWRPPYLSRTILLLVILVLASFIAALESLLWYSRKNYGLVSSTESKHYLWTYGPTAILTMTAAFWSRIDYQLKSNAPWWQMSKGSTSAQKSVLLDYVSPILPTALASALSNRHWHIAATIIVSLLLKILIVVSTSLLTLSLQSITIPHNLTTTSTFNDDPTSLQHVGDLPYKTINGIQSRNLSFPLGTSKDLAFQTFRSLDNAPGAVLSGLVDAYSGDLDCQLAAINVTDLYWAIPYGTPSSVPPQLVSNQGVYTSDCYTTPSITDVSLMFTASNGSFDFEGTEGQRQMYAMFTNGTCEGNLNDQRIVIALGEVIQGPQIGYIKNESLWPYMGSESQVYMNITKSIQLICKPTYQIQKINLSMNASQKASHYPPNIVVTANTTNWTLSRVTSQDVAQAQFSTYQWAENIEGPNGFPDWSGGPSIEYGYGVQSATRWGAAPAQIYFAMKLEGIDEIHTDNITEDFVVRLGRSYWKSYTALIARQYMMNGPSGTTDGTASFSQTRLVVHSLPARVMDGLLSAMIVHIVVILFNITSQRATPRDLSSLAGLLTVSAASNSFLHLVAAVNFAKGLKSVKKQLLNYSFSTKTTMNKVPATFTIEVHNKTGGSILPASSRARTRSWFEPLPLKFAFRLTMATIVVGIMAALEVLLSNSAKNNGIGDINDYGRLHYTWTLLPATVLSLLGIYVSAFDSGFKTLSSYAKLRSGSTFDRSLATNFHDQFSLATLFQAIRLRHPVLLFTTVANVLGLFLTIVVSGIFSHVEVSISESTTVTQNSWFNDSISANKGYFGAGMSVADLVIHNNLSRPTWTYDNLAFASIAIDPLFNGTPSAVKVQTRALRPSMQCKLFPDFNSFCTNTTWDGTVYPALRNHLSLSILGYYSTNCSAEFGQHQASIPVQEDRYFGAFLSYGAVEAGSYVWGKYDGQTLTHIAGMNCTESLDELNVAARFLLPSYDIDDSSPPVFDESSAHASNVTLLENRPDFLANIGVLEELDFVFQAAVYGKDGIALEHLASQAGNSEVMQRVMNMTAMYRAIQYSTDLRIDMTGNRPQHQATLISLDDRRLVQNAVPTHILVGLLGTILLCMLVASFMMHTRHLVPTEPGSIAAMMSFFVGSNMLQDEKIPTGSEWLSDKELKKRGILQEPTFGIEDNRPTALSQSAMEKKTVEKGSVTETVHEEITSPTQNRFTIVMLERSRGVSVSASEKPPDDSAAGDNSLRVSTITELDQTRETTNLLRRKSTNVDAYENTEHQRLDRPETSHDKGLSSHTISMTTQTRFPSLATQTRFPSLKSRGNGRGRGRYESLPTGNIDDGSA